MPRQFASFQAARTLLPLVLLLGATQLHAQSVTGEVVSAEDGQPLAGAFVTLLDADGRSQSGSVTDSLGRYVLRARVPGSYALRVERIGFETVTSAPLELAAGTATYRFVVPARAVQLPQITVESEGRGCSRRSDAAEVHALWEEIRKALDITAWTQRTGTVRYSLVEHRRELDAYGREVLFERRRPHSLLAALPYTAITAPELAQQGFFRAVRDERLLLGLDALVLLSDEFLHGYCFRLVRGSTPAEVGLGFEPVARRAVTDVRGVIWVDRASAELRRVSFAYQNLPGELAGTNAGGDVSFTRLPNGTWIVSEWRIRMPIMTRSANRRVLFASGIREEGGTVVAATEAEGRALFRLLGSGAIEGRLRDPVAGRDVAGAIVHLSGTPHTATVDADGTFRIEDVPPGRYALAFTGTWFDDLRVPVRLDSVTVAPGATVRRDVSGPALAEVLQSICPGERPTTRYRPGVIYGFVIDPVSGRPAVHAELYGQWRDSFGMRSRTVYTNGEGRYVMCWVPQGSAVDLRLNARGPAGAPSRVTVRAPFHRVDF